jgi:DNA-binding NtrC family response regulator
MARVLIVDDDEAFSAAVGRLVRASGHDFESASDGKEGLERARRGEFDVVIADLKMPRMNGIEFIRDLRRVNHGAVVMVITGYADLATAVEAMALGASDYLEKPVAVERFRAALERGLEKRQAVMQLDFAKGAVWMVVLATPLWLLLGILVSWVAR